MAKQAEVNAIQQFVIDEILAGATGISFYEGEVTKDPDWATRRDENGQVVLSDMEFVSFTVNTGGNYATIRAFDEALIEFALGLGGGSRVAIAVEPVNQPGKDGAWRTYLRALAVTAVSVVERVADTDREGAVARRVAADAAPRRSRNTLVL
jgi:hypothetical protein